MEGPKTGPLSVAAIGPNNIESLESRKATADPKV
jgi:hypothetical protein